MITEHLAKAKLENLVVRLHFRRGKSLTCKVVKLLGTEIEVMTNKIERRKIVVNSLASINFVDEHIDELA